VGSFGSTIVRRFSLTDGSNAGNTGAVGGQTSTRDYAFAPNGDLYIRTQGRVSKATRVNNTTFNNPVDLVTWNESSLAQAFVAYVPISTEYFSGFSDLILYNQRVSGQNKVFIIRPDGSVFGELNGSEDTGEPSFTEVAFDNTLLNASWGKTTDGRMFIFVVKGGTGASAFGDRLDIYEVVPEPTSLLALSAGLVGLMRLRRRNR
ncbi:MAG: PEP-CTERM sorting domain-containing protein, partial [Armatimonadetes bacterium]